MMWWVKYIVLVAAVAIGVNGESFLRKGWNQSKEQDRVLVGCGDDNQLTCETGDKCIADHFAFPTSTEGEEKCCDKVRVFYDNGCRGCGGHGQKPCVNDYDANKGCEAGKAISIVGAEQPTAAEIETSELRCYNCGDDNQLACATGDKCVENHFAFPTGTENEEKCCNDNAIFYNGACRGCGGHGQKPCVNANVENHGCQAGKTIFPVGSSQPTAAQIETSDLKCYNCGDDNQLACATGDKCLENHFAFPTATANEEKCCNDNAIFYNGACRGCGGHGQKPCVNTNAENSGCQSGKTIFPVGSSRPTAAEIETSDLKCQTCGGNNQLTCEVGDKCTTDHFAFPTSTEGVEKCCSKNLIFYDNACRACGSHGQKPCVNSEEANSGCLEGKTIFPINAEQPTAAEIELTETKCVTCSDDNQLVCTTGDKCKEDHFAYPTEEGEEKCCSETLIFYAGACRSCGSNNQRPCVNVHEDNFGCQDLKTIYPVGSAQPNAAEIETTALKCFNCGQTNQLACAVGDKCLENHSPFPTGVEGEEKCCDESLIFFNGACRGCGAHGQRPCVNVNDDNFGCKSGTTVFPVGSDQPTAANIEESNLICYNCGNDNLLACATGSKCLADHFPYPTTDEGVEKCCDKTRVFYSNACRSCGGHGQRPCVNLDSENAGCSSGKTIVPVGSAQPKASEIETSELKCYTCGNDNQYACATGDKCLEDHFAYPTETEGVEKCCDQSLIFYSGACRSCGGNGQRPCVQINSENMGCASGKTIFPVGSAQPKSSEIESSELKCYNCGDDNQYTCATGDKCITGHFAFPTDVEGTEKCCNENLIYFNGACRSCGAHGQKPCVNTNAENDGCKSGTTISPVGASKPSPEEIEETTKKCYVCGNDNQLVCSTGDKCLQDHVAFPTTEAGVEKCCHQNLVFFNNACRNCGGHNQRPCTDAESERKGCKEGYTISSPGSAQPTREEIETTSLTCVPCGTAGKPDCETVSANQGPGDVQPPVDCVVSDWTSGSCSAECGGGTATFTRTVEVAPANGGKSCNFASKITLVASASASHLQFCEIELYADEEMTAESRIQLENAVASTTYPGTTPGSAIDGSSVQYWSGGNCFASNDRDPIKSWSADVAGDSAAPVKAIRILNRQDCCKDRLLDTEIYLDGVLVGTVDNVDGLIFELVLGDMDALQYEGECGTGPCPTPCEAGEWSDLSTCSELCGATGTQVRSLPIITKAMHGGSCDIPEASGFVGSEIRLERDDMLQLCELELFEDTDMTQKVVLSNAVAGSTYATSHADRVIDGDDDSSWYSNHCFASGILGPHTWKATINTNNPIKAIRIANRMDCCRDRILDMRIYIDDVLVHTIPNEGSPGKEEYQIILDSNTCDNGACVHCEGQFVDSGECSELCGGGELAQVYAVTQEAGPGGNPCPYENGESGTPIPCNTDACVHCEGEFVDDGECSELCGGGELAQVYSVTQEAGPGGEACPYTDGEPGTPMPCNLDACIPCVGEFQNVPDTQCSKICGGGLQEQVFVVTQEAGPGGAACPFATSSQNFADCNTDVPCSCTARVIAGVDFTIDNQGQTTRQVQFQVAQLAAIVNSLGDTLHVDLAHMAVSGMHAESVEEFVTLDSSDAYNANTLQNLLQSIAASAPQYAARDKDTAFAAFMASAAAELSEETDHPTFIVLMTDGLPPSLNRKKLATLYSEIDAALAVPNPPTILCYRPNTWSRWDGLMDRYCSLTWTHQEGEKENKNRDVVGFEMARHICPVQRGEDAETQIKAENPCTPLNKKDCNRLRRNSDGTEPEGNGGFKFCQWVKQSAFCEPKDKYKVLFDETTSQDAPNHSVLDPEVAANDPCIELVNVKKCKKKKTKINGKNTSICNYNASTGLCELKSEYIQFFVNQ